MRSKTFLVTGGSGFLGQALINQLVRLPGCTVVAPMRNLSARLAAGARSFALNNLDGANDWQVTLNDVDVVIHAAARVHVMNEVAVDPLAAFREVNVEATLNLARQAQADLISKLRSAAKIQRLDDASAASRARPEE